MALQASFRLVPLVAPAICLAGASVAHAAWHPLQAQVINRSGQSWTLDFTASTHWKLGYSTAYESSGGHRDPVALDSKEAFLLHGNTALRLYVDTEGSDSKADSVHVTVKDLLGNQGTVDGTLEIGASARFRKISRRIGYRQDQLVLVHAGSILIMDNPAAGTKIMETKGDDKAAGKADLPALNDFDMKAGMDNFGLYYTVERIAYVENWNPNGWGPLHQKGNLFPPELLEDYFANTIFQYNTNRFTGFDPHLNYDQYPTMPKFGANYQKWLDRLCKPDGVQVLTPPKEGGNFKLFIEYKAALDRAMEAFQRNSTLISLGIAYMRQKIITEKIQTAMKELTSEQVEKAQKILLAHDRLAIDLQTMIFQWMKQGYGEFVSQYKMAPMANAGDMLETFQPKFISEPYYAKIISNLGEYGKATDVIDSIKLPEK